LNSETQANAFEAEVYYHASQVRQTTKLLSTMKQINLTTGNFRPAVMPEIAYGCRAGKRSYGSVEERNDSQPSMERTT
jgi:hypothetical protein